MKGTYRSGEGGEKHMMWPRIWVTTKAEANQKERRQCMGSDKDNPPFLRETRGCRKVLSIPYLDIYLAICDGL